jgi:hypothetical protein
MTEDHDTNGDVQVRPQGQHCPALQLMSTAYRHAGTAIACDAVWPQSVVEHVSLLPREDHSGVAGHVQHAALNEEWRKEDKDDHKARSEAARAIALIKLAGILSESQFRGEDVELPRGYRLTRDIADIPEAIRRMCDDDDELIDLVYDYGVETSQLLLPPDVSVAIAQVAGRLLRSLRLTGSEVGVVVSATGVSLAWWQARRYTWEAEEPPGDAFSWERW